MVTTTDPKVLGGLLYLVTSFAFFAIGGGVMALIMRSELAVPGMQFLSNEQYNQLFTMHGTIMLLMYATPGGLRLRQLHPAAADRRPGRGLPPGSTPSATGCTCSARSSPSAASSPPGGAADFGWTAYAPLNSELHSPGMGANLWIVGLAVSGLGTILGAVNFVTTIVCLRAPPA